MEGWLLRSRGEEEEKKRSDQSQSLPVVITWSSFVCATCPRAIRFTNH